MLFLDVIVRLMRYREGYFLCSFLIGCIGGRNSLFGENL